MMSTVASISTPESSLLDKPSRSEEIRDIDRAALAQKFSVTRRLFETKMMEAEGGGGQVSKSVTGRGNKGITYGHIEGENGGGSQVEKEEEESGKRKHAAVDGFYKDKSINTPVINISSLKIQPQTSLTRQPKCPGPSEASNKAACPDKHDQTTGPLTEDPCLTPEEPLRAELVSVKNESSESDENEEEKEQKENNYFLKDKEENDMNNVEELVDDVFEEPNMATTPELYMLENRVEVKTGEVRPVASSEEHQKLSTSVACERETKDDRESGRDKYQQVNEQCEGKRKEQNKPFVARDEKSEDMWEENKEKNTNAGGEKSARWKDRGVMQLEDVDNEVERKVTDEGGVKRCRQRQEKERTEKGKERERQEVTAPEHANEVKHVVCRGGGGDGAGGEEDKTESAIICGIENKAFVYYQESQAHPEHSPRQDLESSLRTGSRLLLEYEEILGVPEQDDEDASDLPKRKVKFSSAPIKVKKTLICVAVSSSCCLNPYT